MLEIEGFKVHRLTVPLGRMIGDNNCSYDEINVFALELRTKQGCVGWGYAESIWRGTFKNPAWYIRPLLSLEDLNSKFGKSWWPRLSGKTPAEVEEDRLNFKSEYPYIDAAVRLALWDLMAQEADLPLYRYLNRAGMTDRAEAYGSPLDFPLDDEKTLTFTRHFLNLGFKTIKVKIGAPDITRDIERLQLIKQHAGPAVNLVADANEAWDWQTALKNLEIIDREGIKLEYIEDPLNRNDLAGLRELTGRSPIPVIGHDYINDIEGLRQLVEIGGVKGLRSGKDMDYIIQCVNLAKEYDLPLYLVNSLFEVNVHAAIAFPQVKRMEFADLGLNYIIREPVQFDEGFAIGPKQPGHGLVPLPLKLKQYRNHNVEVIKS